MIILVIRGITLPGAVVGLSYYLTPVFSALKNLNVWLAAYGQVFFSLSVGFGVMIAYASYLPPKSDIVNNALIIALVDAGTAFMAGLCVFSTLGYYTHAQGVSIEQTITSSIPLAFITFPTIINHLPFFRPMFGFLFFLMIFFLGIDSAFSLVEAFSCGVIDKWRFKRAPVLLTLGLIGVALGLPFATCAGILWLDIVDNFMSNWGLVTVGLLECILLGYAYNLNKLRSHANETSEFRLGNWWNFMIKILAPVVLVVLLGVEIYGRIRDPYGGYPRMAELIGGYGLIALFVIISIVLMRKRGR